MFMSTRQYAGLVMIGLAAASPAKAGVPFITDDADTADKGHYEINLGTQYTHRSGETGGAILGVDANYGITEHLEVHVYVPLAFDHTPDSSTRIGFADIELGVKYRLLDADDWGGWKPNIAVAPTIIAPSGARSNNLGTGSVHAFIPVWMSKEFGKWTPFAGVGYALNPGQGNRNWVFTGVGATYEIDPKWTVGAEVFYTSATVSGERGAAGFNVGGIYNINNTYHLLYSVGRNLTNPNLMNAFSTFAGVQLNF